MKKICTIITAVFLTVLMVKAQDDKVAFGIRAGINFQNFNGKDFNGDKLENNMLVGFHAGVTVDIPIAPEFVVQPGLLFSMKGSSYNSDIVDATARVNYIELPVNFIFKPLLGTGHLLLGLGPYIGYGVNGKVSGSALGFDVDTDIKFKNNLSADETEDEFFYLKRWDAGANLLAGYEFAFGLSFQINAQLGLLKINPSYEGDSGDESATRNTGFGVSIGYRF